MVYDRYAFAVPQEKQVRLITDTDAKNEADDQFAVVQALLSPKMDNVGLIAAHFGIDRVPDAMEASYRELETILDKMYLPKDGLLYHGAPHALPDRTAPVVSEGAELIVREAMKDDPRRLFVIFLGPLTDLASAYLMEPRIANRADRHMDWRRRLPFREPGVQFGQRRQRRKRSIFQQNRAVAGAKERL